ncbi:hypothetical protein AWB80_07567 [Caballeronia pedi]|uniref:Uncharacterized protein n=1 Tax=Caballeronia pedi TaxID=1777141 RepID=A0A158DY76_9BURK|nr:hypothetical protein [Caballeronia pedi]SAK98667.1 hypothetical protein AWB80_07567 [Caballeronia pedi]
MSQAPGLPQFDEHVEGVGTFTFARRNMRRELAIATEFSRLTEGVATPSPFLETVAGMISTLKVLTLLAPAGWDLDELDPLDDESYAKLMKVHAALRAKEGSFRRKNGVASEAQRSGDGNDAALLVSSQVQPGTDGR